MVGPRKSSSGSTAAAEEGDTTPPPPPPPPLVGAVFLRLEVGRHAALHLAVLLDAAPERHALQVALQRIVPLVVRTGEVLAVAVPLATKAHAAVRADVLDDVEPAVLVAHQDHRALADD